jgi:hypothetical protein
VSSRVLALLVVATLCVLGGVAYVVVAASTPGETTSDAQPRVLVEEDADLPAGSALIVRAVDRRNPRLNGRVYRIELTPGATPKRLGDLTCERVHVNPMGEGICLAVSPNAYDYRAVIFDRRYRRRSRFSIDGVPDRARASIDGRYAAFTTFLSGHTYTAGVRQFSTRTTMVNMASGKPWYSFDKVEILRNGKPFEQPDSNIWGVTYSGSDRFYATLGAGGKFYLITGWNTDESAEIVREGVECPSISPDETRIAYKRRIGKLDAWRLHVLNLESGRDIALPERRSIDDQPEWLGNRHIVYSDDRDVYVVRSDGSRRPERVVAGASSPTGIP